MEFAERYATMTAGLDALEAHAMFPCEETQQAVYDTHEESRKVLGVLAEEFKSRHFTKESPDA